LYLTSHFELHVRLLGEYSLLEKSGVSHLITVKGYFLKQFQPFCFNPVVFFQVFITSDATKA